MKRFIFLGFFAHLSLFSVLPPSNLLAEDTSGKQKPEEKAWSGSLTLAYGATGGNAVTESFTPSFTITHEKNGSKFDARGDMAYAEFDHKATQNTAFGDFSFRDDFANDKKFGDSTLYWGAALGAMHDDISDIDYRFDGFTGLGIHAVKLESFTSDFEAGPGFRVEKENQVQRDYATYIVANNSSVKLTDNSSLGLWTSYVSSMDEHDNWILFLKPTLQVMMTKMIGIKIGGWYRYENEPSRVAKKDDWVFSTGIGVNF